MNINDRRLGAYRRASGSAPEGATSDETTGEARPGGATPGSSTPGGSTPKGEGTKPGFLKVPDRDAREGERPRASATGGSESPYRKVAKFLLLIGVDEAARVMSRLTEEQTERVVSEIASIRSVSPEESALVLAEFKSLLVRAREPQGGVSTARSILESAFGEERAREMLERSVPFPDGKPFDYLEGMDPARVLALVADELPAVRALVLSNVKPKEAAEVIKLMGEKDRTETVVRLAKLKSIQPEVLRRVDDAMREKVATVGKGPTDAIDGRAALADILRRMDGRNERAILDSLARNDEELGRDIRARLFTLEDVARADDRFVQETLRPMGERDIAVLIAGKSADFRKKILSNVSKTRGALILEEEKLADPVSRAESESVTGSFHAVMRRAWEDGRLFVGSRDDKEEWVE